MANAYWTFYRQISKILKDGKVKFDEPRGKVRFISDAWKKEKIRINSLNADAESKDENIPKETLEALFIAKTAEAKAEKAKAIEALAKVVDARAARLQAEKYLYEMQERAKIALADAAEVIEKWEKMKAAVK
jgi:hypothetical protein